MIGQGKPWDFAHLQKNLTNVLHRSVEITGVKRSFKQFFSGDQDLNVCFHQ